MLQILVLLLFTSIPQSVKPVRPVSRLTKSQMSCVIRQFKPLMKTGRMEQIVDSVKEGASNYGINESLILAFMKTESNFSNISNKSYPYDTGLLQVLPHDSHIRHFLWIYAGKKAKRNALKTLRSDVQIAIVAGIYEMAYWEDKLNISKRMQRKYRKLPWYLRQRLGKYKWVPFYNWGPRVYKRGTKPFAYPYRILKNLNLVAKYYDRCLIKPAVIKKP